MNRPPLDYRPPRDDPPPPLPWWKFRFERHHILPLVILSIFMSIAPLHAAYVERPHRRRTATPPPPPPATRPANITLPPL